MRRRRKMEKLVTENSILSAQQLACLRGVAKGQTSAQIGSALGLSKRTVDHYLAMACLRLGAKNRAQAVKCAMELMLIGPRDE